MKKFISALGLFLVPGLALAQAQFSGSQGTIGGILTTIVGILNFLVPALITLGIVYFIWGVIGYITAGDDEKKNAARTHMIYGIIGLFVIVSVWGLVTVLQNTFGTGSGAPSQQLPCLFNDPGIPGPC